MKHILENGLSAYQILGDALRDYEGVLHASGLYWACSTTTVWMCKYKSPWHRTLKLSIINQ